jgi:head-tail adaptor
MSPARVLPAADGERTCEITLQNPGAGVPDGDGGYTESWVDCVPATVYASMQPASARAMEYLGGSSSVQASATHIVRIPFHPQITIHSRVLYRDHGLRDHVLNVAGLVNPEMRERELILFCAELLP